MPAFHRRTPRRTKTFPWKVASPYDPTANTSASEGGGSRSIVRSQSLRKSDTVPPTSAAKIFSWTCGRLIRSKSARTRSPRFTTEYTKPSRVSRDKALAPATATGPTPQSGCRSKNCSARFKKTTAEILSLTRQLKIRLRFHSLSKSARWFY